MNRGIKFFFRPCVRFVRKVYLHISKLQTEDILKKVKAEFETQNIVLRDHILPPQSILPYLIKNNCTPKDFLYRLWWKQSDIPFEDIDRVWRCILINGGNEYWLLFEHYMNFSFHHGDLFGDMDSMYQSHLADFDKWTDECSLEYVSYLLWKKRYSQAEEQLKKHITIHGDERLHLYLPVAHLAREKLGVNSPLIDKAATQYQRMLDNTDTFRNLVENTVPALVGNGPQEKGTGGGVFFMRSSFAYREAA